MNECPCADPACHERGCKEISRLQANLSAARKVIWWYADCNGSSESPPGEKARAFLANQTGEDGA